MRYVIFLLFIFIPFISHATDMCARNDTMVMVFDPDVSGISAVITDSDAWTWSASFKYGNIYGDSACVSKYEYENKQSEITAGLKGTDKNGDERTICVCRMLHPVQSPWVSFATNASADKCISQCMGIYSHCGNYLYRNGGDSYRKTMFNSIGL